MLKFKQRPSFRTDEPGARLFRGLRVRLTLWYSGVLGLALLVFGFALYFTMEEILFSPVKNEIATQAKTLAQIWQTSPDFTCPLVQIKNNLPVYPDLPIPFNQGPVPVYVACMDAEGQVITSAGGLSTQLFPEPKAFINDKLVKTTLAAGQASDIIDGGKDVGAVYRYALAVTPPSGNSPAGIVQLGRSVSDLQTALLVLRNLLLLLGLLVLVVATLGGLFLATRALIPARLAFTRQQAFIADASHELNTPLTLLRSDAEVLLRNRTNFAPEDAELLEDIVAETAHMSKLANRMLSLARLDAGKFQLELEVIDLSELSAAVFHRVRMLAREREIQLVEHYNLTQVLVVGDQQLLEQVILILLDNALKYTPPGGQILTQTQIDKKQAKLIIQDSGSGIASEHLPYLGERFYRIDKARSREAGGVGLGLSLARSIVQAHQGSLNLSSEIGKGTTVTVTLPTGN